MRRSIKKAAAFTLAAVTMFANLGVTSPVKAAEYGELKEVLAPEYDYGMQVGENTLFTKCSVTHTRLRFMGRQLSIRQRWCKAPYQYQNSSRKKGKYALVPCT